MGDPVLPVVKVDVLDLSASTPALSSTTDIPIIEKKPDSQSAFDGEKACVKDDKAAPEEGKTPEEAALPEDDETPTEEDSGGPDKAKKPAKGVQTALDRLTKERAEQRERAEAAERRLDKALAGLEKATPKPEAKPEPKREDFEDPDAYAEAKAEFIAEQKVTEKLRAKEQQDFEAQVQRETENTQKAYAERVSKAKDDLPDFAEVTSQDIKIPMEAVQAILLHEKAPYIQYYLGKHPEVAEALFKLNPIQVVSRIAEIGIEVGKPTRAVSKAPEPIKPLGSRESASKDPSEMSMDEYAAYAKERDANARKARSRR